MDPKKLWERIKSMMASGEMEESEAMGMAAEAGYEGLDELRAAAGNAAKGMMNRAMYPPSTYEVAPEDAEEGVVLPDWLQAAAGAASGVGDAVGGAVDAMSGLGERTYEMAPEGAQEGDTSYFGKGLVDKGVDAFGDLMGSVKGALGRGEPAPEYGAGEYRASSEQPDPRDAPVHREYRTEEHTKAKELLRQAQAAISRGMGMDKVVKVVKDQGFDGMDTLITAAEGRAPGERSPMDKFRKSAADVGGMAGDVGEYLIGQGGKAASAIGGAYEEMNKRGEMMKFIKTMERNPQEGAAMLQDEEFRNKIDPEMLESLLNKVRPEGYYPRGGGR